jgi:hypothetical protein
MRDGPPACPRNELFDVGHAHRPGPHPLTPGIAAQGRSNAAHWPATASHRGILEMPWRGGLPKWMLRVYAYAASFICFLSILAALKRQSGTSPPGSVDEAVAPDSPEPSTGDLPRRLAGSPLALERRLGWWEMVGLLSACSLFHALGLRRERPGRQEQGARRPSRAGDSNGGSRAGIWKTPAALARDFMLIKPFQI